jgi:hypothetical protein
LHIPKIEPYWKSNLTFKEAQNLSKDGIAVLGNPIIKNVIWPKISQYPLGWNKDAYYPLDTKLFENKLGWVPAESIDEL